MTTPTWEPVAAFVRGMASLLLWPKPVSVPTHTDADALKADWVWVLGPDLGGARLTKRGRRKMRRARRDAPSASPNDTHNAPA